MWLFREVSSPYLFVLAQIDPDIQWRSHSFRLKFGGTAELKKQVCIHECNYGWTLSCISYQIISKILCTHIFIFCTTGEVMIPDIPSIHTMKLLTK